MDTLATKDMVAVESELNIARNIQMSIIPKMPLQRKDIDIYGYMQPAKDVGGDFFDFFIRDERLFFSIGDVSGKGVSAALPMATTCTAFRLLAESESKLERIVSRINDSMTLEKEPDFFVTLFVGALDLATGRLTYCNAGHKCPYVNGRSVNGDDAGDYYAVRSTVVPHKSLVWGPYVGKHGACRNRVYGYWFDDMDYEFVLVDPDTNQPADGLHFSDLPFPENSVASRNHSDSHSVGVNGSLSLGYKSSDKMGEEGSISGSVGFSCDWTESIAYTLANIDYSRNSSTNWVKYHWYSNNVTLKDDMNNIQKYFPNDVHEEFDAKNVWMWHVPYNRAGVTDGSAKQFKLLARVRPRYSSWYHWRGTVTFPANRKDWNVDFAGKYTSTEKGWAGCTFTLPAPDRSTWGLISLKNASNHTMRNVKIYAKGKESQAPVAEIPNTYASQELAKTAVLEGTYTVTFEFINPNNNQVISKGVLNDVKVKMGKTQEAATTSISTGEAKLQ